MGWVVGEKVGPANTTSWACSIYSSHLLPSTHLQNVSFSSISERKRGKIDGFSLNIYILFPLKDKKYFKKWGKNVRRKKRRKISSTRRQWQPRSETKICHFNMDFSFGEKCVLPLRLAAPLLLHNSCLSGWIQNEILLLRSEKFIYIKKYKTISMLWSHWSDDVNNVIGRDYLTTRAGICEYFSPLNCCRRIFRVMSKEEINLIMTMMWKHFTFNSSKQHEMWFWQISSSHRNLGRGSRFSLSVSLPLLLSKRATVAAVFDLFTSQMLFQISQKSLN